MLAVIPARGGSKGVPHKNIRDLDGKPLIAYTIEAAIKSKVFDKIVVSTDSSEIAEIAQRYGAEVPFIRPKDLSGDFSSSDDVVLHAIDYLKRKGKEFEYVCKLQPTSPLRNETHIMEAYRLLKDSNSNFVVSVCECEHSPLWTEILDEKRSLDGFINEYVKGACRQKLPKYYRLNGAIYMGRTEAFEDNKSFFGKNGTAFIMNQEESIDIDNYFDFEIAKLLIERNSCDENINGSL